MKLHTFALRALCVLGASMTFAASAQTTYTWTGGGSDDNWSTAGNWSNGVPASSGNSVLVFSGSTRTSPNNNLGDWNLSVGRLEFASGSASFTSGQGWLRNAHADGKQFLLGRHDRFEGATRRYDRESPGGDRQQRLRDVQSADRRHLLRSDERLRAPYQVLARHAHRK